MKKYLLLLLIFAMIISLFPYNNVQALTSEPIVKVKLVNYLGNKSEITIKPNGDYITNDSNVVLKTGETYVLKLVNGKLSLYQNGSLLNSYDTFSAQAVQPRTALSINNRLYLGSFDFVIENNQYVRPINSVYMEDYLKGVVPLEMYPSWNLEALKTQAVAARTYAISYLSRGIINDTISYQVYGGYIWTPNTTKAVEDTKGQVLLSGGRLIDAVYSASNGGMTESNANAWGNIQVPYLTIKEDSFDPKTPWVFSFNKTQIDLTGKDLSKSSEWWTATKEADATIAYNLKMWLNNNGYANKDIKIVSISDFSLHNKGTGGRVSLGNITVDFLVKDMVDASGKLIPQRVSYKDVGVSRIRAMIGNRVMLSYLVDSVNTETAIVSVKGNGDGHGVGMSQWGAKYMGDAGKSYEEILKFYYTGVTITPTYAEIDKSVAPTTITPVQAAVTQAVTSEPEQPVVVTDTTAPIIIDVTNSYNATKKAYSLTYSINEESLVTVYVKDSKGVILKQLETEVKKAAGKYTADWAVSTLTNGDYTFGIIATDLAGNKASAVSKFTVNNPVKDTKAPSVNNVSATHNNSTKKVTLAYSVDETSYVTINVKDSKGKIVKTLQSNFKKSAGKYSLVWDAVKNTNGAYTVEIIASDVAKNRSIAPHKFTLNNVFKGKITVNNVVIRQNTSSSSKALGRLNKNNEVVVIQKTGSWYYIQSGKTKGYITPGQITNIK
ncbi:SpoIID/LytB domain-containing protein [Robertmurraya sp. GLU-23]